MPYRYRISAVSDPNDQEHGQEAPRPDEGGQLSEVQDGRQLNASFSERERWDNGVQQISHLPLKNKNTRE